MKKWPLQISPWTEKYHIIKGKASLLPSGPNSSYEAKRTEPQTWNENQNEF